MNDIRAILRLAARRLEFSSFIDRLHWAAMMVAGLALALMIADRLTAKAFIPWVWVGPAFGVLALGVAVALWIRRRLTEAHVALVVDERLDLREKLSTALHVHGRNDPFAQAAMEDAVLTARDARTHELVRRRFKIQPPGMWWISPLIVLAAVMTSLLKPLDLFGRQPQPDPTAIEAKLQADQSVEAIIREIQEKPQLSKELGLGDLSREGTDPNALRRPEDFKRDALKKMTTLNNKLDQILSGEKGKTAEALEKSLNSLKTPEDGGAKELAQALANGDFNKAQQALKEMLAKLESGQMSDEDKKKLAEQLQNIAEQLQQLAQQQQQLENALKQAGMDPNLARNPQALQQAIQNNQNLNQQQKEQLQQMAQAQQAAAQMCQGLGQACQKMAQACQGNQQGQLGQAGQQMAQQIGQMEALQQLLKEAQAAASACQGSCNKIGQGLTMQDALKAWSLKSGVNQGSWGRAAGGRGAVAPTPWNKKSEKANVNTVESDVIAKMLFEGPQIRGESKAKLVQVVEQAKKGYDEALSEDQVHVRYREAQQHYFGELEKLTKAIELDKTSRDKSQPAPKDEPVKK